MIIQYVTFNNNQDFVAWQQSNLINFPDRKIASVLPLAAGFAANTAENRYATDSKTESVIAAKIEIAVFVTFYDSVID